MTRTHKKEYYFNENIYQGEKVYPSTIYFKSSEPVSIRLETHRIIKGEIHFKILDSLCKLSFQGSLPEVGSLAWISQKLKGMF